MADRVRHGNNARQTDSGDEEAATFRRVRQRGSMICATQYIEKITGRRMSDEEDEAKEEMAVQEAAEHSPTSMDEDSASDIEITGILSKSKDTKGKRKAVDLSALVEWSDEDENDNIYEQFKNRPTKRSKTAREKKKAKEKVKVVVEQRKSAKANEDVVKKRREWGDASDYEMDDDIPEYVQERRREFDEKYKKLEEAGLQLPPKYDEVYFSDDERLAGLKERPDFPASVEPSRKYKDIPLPYSGGMIPASIAQYLRDYQIDGVAFLHELFVYQKGGILGDDMGLGKTVQVAAFLTAAFGKTGDERDEKRMRKMRRAGRKSWYPRVLIVCPGSLMENWRVELQRWGWWHVDKFHGAAQEKEAVLQAAIAGRMEIVITTYHTYRRAKDQLNTVKWDCVVADECHILKEPSSETTKAMNEVNAICRIGLTGTAIQNKYEELWTLLNWTNPGKFGPIWQWKTAICEPMRIGQSHDATYHQLKIGRRTATNLVGNLLPQFFLRRMKSLIAHQLPKKTDKVVFCPLTDIQKDAYERFLDCDVVGIVRNSSHNCDCGSGKKAGWCCYMTLGGTKWRALVFPIIAKLQKLSNHLALLIPNSKEPLDKQGRDLEFLQKMVPDRWQELYAKRDQIYNLSNPEFCGKWKILKKLLSFWHENGDKCLIFSHSVKLLQMLHNLFNNTSYNVSFLSGSMATDDRQRTVDEFNSDPGQFVFLISTKAGGVGLNITSANKVVIFDPNWNPSYDLQAQDRAYRIGQLRDVEVFRLVSTGTIEEIVYARQIYKQQQANIGYNASTERRYFKGVQSNKTQKGELFGLDNLLSFHADNIILRDIVNKTNVAEAKRGVDILDVDMDGVLEDEDNPLKVDDDERGEGAMSQLAALIAKGETLDPSTKPKQKKRKMDAVAAILAAAGVSYTHENSEVIGSSRVEAELSRRAEEAGNDVEFGEDKLFADSGRRDEDGRVLWNPPEDVMRRQFCTMAKTFGFETAEEFALCVEGWTQKQRTDCLERFYLRRKERLAELNDEQADEDSMSHGFCQNAVQSLAHSLATTTAGINGNNAYESNNGVATNLGSANPGTLVDKELDFALEMETETDSDGDDEL